MRIKLNPIPLSMNKRLWVEKHFLNPFGFNLCSWCNRLIDSNYMRCKNCQLEWMEYMREELENE